MVNISSPCPVLLREGGGAEIGGGPKSEVFHQRTLIAGRGTGHTYALTKLAQNIVDRARVTANLEGVHLAFLLLMHTYVGMPIDEIRFVASMASGKSIVCRRA
eukprot:GEMP01085089.1.p2 GENE.GEMP01085089.1~~GEMP01085089.1.p2  ORF type:complete len:103 (-),score=11.48 GEMP01085089.1:625-933(-)